MKYILADTGFWIALFDKKDLKKFDIANDILLEIKTAKYKILISYSIYSELLRKKYFLKGDKKSKIEGLERLLKSGIIKLIDDTKYEEKALAVTLYETKLCKTISYVDNILRLIIEDFHENISFFITFDIDHFYDVCERNNVQIHKKCFMNT